MRQDELHGTELDWIAADSSGQLAIFSTAGSGPVPARSLERRADQLAIIQWMSRESMLPAWADPLTFIGDAPFFFYDWQVHTGPYLRTRTPAGSLPAIALHQLPPPLRTFVFRFDLQFGEHLHVPADLLADNPPT